MNQQDQDKAKEYCDKYRDEYLKESVQEAFLAGAKYKEEQQTSIKEKADKWDALEKKISKYYFDENGDENPEVEGDLGDIGLDAASAFGYL
jgi:hypothetical protein